MRRTVIVGGVAAGMSTATRLRRNDENMEIVVLERGPYVSFANCGLPYHLGGTIAERDELLLHTPESLAERFDIDVRASHEVVSIDRGARTITVVDRSADTTGTLSYDALVLATGASAVVPPIPGIERAHTLRDVPDLDSVMADLERDPRSAVVLGGGFVGLEAAENLAGRGLDVTIVEAADQILAPLDAEMAAVVARHLEVNGVRVRTGLRAVAIGEDSVRLDDDTAVPAALVLASTGVRPESGLARDAGLDLGLGGGVLVDAQRRTSDPRIFAVGDVAVESSAVTGQDTLVPLANIANRHGRMVADVICGRTAGALPSLGTAIVGLFGLAAAVVGVNERTLRQQGRAIHVIHTHPSDHAGYYPGAEMMKLKLVVDAETGLILGAQGVGRSGVDKRIDVIATAMRAGLSAADLADLELAYAPQFGSAKDPVNMLGMIADNLAAGTARVTQWHEVDAAVAAGATVLDVRTPEEVAAGAIAGAVNIPLDELRKRLDEVPDGPVIATCRVGMRGYLATRILTQEGRDATNLDGGMLTWEDAGLPLA
ncbi:FAD-dependent oxidoreductase [Speluncibacter jeojiensis]|uniref:FAD-dependent oxidoreductase n=1 Tax=Speluncibacter jeojiensis TaxID=2710754 RepID=A0A9X4M4W1_9ACTN|nr:FAD-dependent oxidoreductase [Corynebacteriales bacterium D3-21]